MTMLDDRVSANGHSPAEHQAEAEAGRIPFADRGTQNVPIDWAETMLRGLFMHHPGIFRQLLFYAATGNDLLTYEPEIAAQRRNRRRVAPNRATDEH
jgi:hypothetical protein